MIVSGGMNSYADKVGIVVQEHPSVTESAVIGVPNENWNKAVKTYIVGDEVTEDELEQWCKDHERLRELPAAK
jgi:acyl-CoA synthetase (AMP-forming)/AMP-acid ligase II